MRPSAYPHQEKKNPDPKFTLVADRRGYIFKRNNRDKKASLEPTGTRQIPVSGTLNLGIKEFKRAQTKATSYSTANPKHRNMRGKGIQMYKDHAWGEVEKGLDRHIAEQDKKKPKKSAKVKK